MSLIDPRPPGTPPVKRITILQGEAKASADAGVEYSTVLGSCVATCLFDPIAKVGGMNHFLLAEPPEHMKDVAFDDHYGLFLMELLINEMMKLGAVKSRLKARLYGGAKMNATLADIGASNAAFARSFMAQEGIAVGFEDFGGHHARRLYFRPATGQVRCRETAPVEAPKQKPQASRKSDIGDVELF